MFSLISRIPHLIQNFSGKKVWLIRRCLQYILPHQSQSRPVTQHSRCNLVWLYLPVTPVNAIDKQNSFPLNKSVRQTQQPINLNESSFCHNLSSQLQSTRTITIIFLLSDPHKHNLQEKSNTHYKLNKHNIKETNC